MPIRVAATVMPLNRDENVRSSDFFYTINTSDIDLSIDAILANASETISSTLNTKYIILNTASSPISVPNLANNDIVIHDGNDWVLHKSVGNTETNFGLVFDKRTQLFYQYDSTNGWKPLLRSGKIDGGTFS
jgi:hypothetical protein